MESEDQIRINWLPTRGVVVRATVPGKRRGRLEDVFLIEFEGVSPEEIARIWLGEKASIVDTAEFALAGDPDIAILYSRTLTGTDSDMTASSSPVTSRGVPEGMLVEQPALDTAEFFALVHRPDSLALEIGAVEVARHVADSLPTGRVPAFWARQAQLLDQLAVEHPHNIRGTDSFLYWTLACLFGNRYPLDDRAGERRLTFSNPELEAAEHFVSLSETAYFIQTGRNVAFYAPPPTPIEPHTKSLGAVNPGGLLGFYFIGHYADGARVECAGMATGVVNYPEFDSLALERRVRRLAAQTGIIVDELFSEHTGTQYPYNGQEFISLVPR